MHMIKYIAVVFFVGVWSQAMAATIHVEKDGSGDFTVIQAAVDAAADGDVIEIGPGQYEEYQPYNWSLDVYVWVRDKSLTFRGSGPDETIIGPGDPYVHNQSGGMIFRDGAFLRVENLSFKNMWNGPGIDASVEILEIENCVFRGGDYNLLPDGILLDSSQGGYIRNCQFLDLDVGVGIFSPTSGLVVEDCYFSGFWQGVSAGWSGSVSTVRNCEFLGEGRQNSIGVQIWSGASLTLESCSISGCARAGVLISDNGPVFVRDCTITQLGGSGIRLHSNYAAQFENNIVVSDVACIMILENGTVGASFFHNNHFIREGDGWFIQGFPDGYQHPGERVAMQSNYWGTQDLEEIATWIYDWNDDPDVGFVINFEPIADGPVSTETMTLDGVKALYR